MEVERAGGNLWQCQRQGARVGTEARWELKWVLFKGFFLRLFVVSWFSLYSVRPWHIQRQVSSDRSVKKKNGLILPLFCVLFRFQFPRFFISSPFISILRQTGRHPVSPFAKQCKKFATATRNNSSARLHSQHCVAVAGET